MTDLDGPRRKLSAPARWTIAVVSIAVGIGLVVFRSEITEWWSGAFSTFTTADEFREWVEGFGAWGPLVFLLAQAMQVILVPVPGAIFPPVGALAFGPWLALVLSLAGMMIGSAIVFLAARRWGRPLALRFAGEERVSRYEGLIEARGNILLWAVFLLPLLPDDAICALAGVSKISFKRFLVIATVGRVPAVAVGVFTTAGLEGAPGWVWLAVTAVGVGLIWVGSRYRVGLEHRLLRSARDESPAIPEAKELAAPADEARRPSGAREN